MTPTVGRIVHYYRPSSVPDNELEPLAAIITAVELSETTGTIEEHRYRVHLAVFPPGDSYGKFEPITHVPGKFEPITHVPFCAKPRSGCWTWPPRV